MLEGVSGDEKENLAQLDKIAATAQSSVQELKEALVQVRGNANENINQLSATDSALDTIFDTLSSELSRSNVERQNEVVKLVANWMALQHWRRPADIT